MTIWGFVHGYPEEILDDLVAMLAGGVRDTLNRKHQSFTFAGWEWYFYETTPAPRVRYGAAPGPNNAIIRGFTIDVEISSMVSLPQDSGG